jgi:acetolactate synthase I/II/III large subunit
VANVEGDLAGANEADGKTMQTRGAQAVVAALRASGIELVFGYPGGGLPEIVGPLYDIGIKSIAARTELSAAWMSYGYNRARHRAASACLFHEVGLLHTSPAIYAAKLDSTPLFVMGLNIASSLDLREPLQEGLELYPALKPVTKYIRKVVVADDLPLAVRQSVIAASTGRFGPSVLEFAFQVLGQPVTCPVEPLELPAPPAVDEQALRRAWDMITAAERPVLVVGGGVEHANGAEALRRFADPTGIPVVSSNRGGRWLMPDDHELYAGPLGSFGWTSANTVAQAADLWIAVGISFSQSTTAAWTLDKPANVIQVDIDPYELGKIFQPTLGIVADGRVALEQLHALASAGETPRQTGVAYRREVLEIKSAWHEEYDARFDGTEKPISQLYLLDVLNDELPDGSLCLSDSGGHAGFLFRGLKHGDVITPSIASTRYQSLGAGLPMAIGAKLAEPDRTVVTYHGDGGFYYDMMDLATLREHNIKVIVIIDNNGCVMFNRAGFQLRGMNPDLGGWTMLPDTDFVGLARSFGLDGERVENPADLRGAVRRALEADGSYLIDVVTDSETRMKRAIPNVIPNLFDRSPDQQAAIDDSRSRIHYDLRLDTSWPA